MGAGRYVASMVDNKHLKCTDTLPLYITSESTISQMNFSVLLLPWYYEIQIIGFSCSSICECLSIDASITNVGLILTKLRWFQLVSTSQNSILNFFEKKCQIFGFPWSSTREDLNKDASITNHKCRTDIDEAMVIFFRSTNRQTYRRGFGILIWKHVGTQKI